MILPKRQESIQLDSELNLDQAAAKTSAGDHQPHVLDENSGQDSRESNESSRAASARQP